jgi:ABC-type branched-subunit amino acid transport system ATPase component
VITKLSIGHFKAIASATIPLGPITVLIGPNDSGKSTILQALMALSRCADPARLNAEQLLECPASIAATQGDTQTDIQISAEGAVAMKGGRQQPYSFRYGATLSSRINAIVAEEASSHGTPLLLTTPSTAAVVDGESRWEYPRGGGVTELSGFMSHQNAARNATTQMLFEAIAAELRATMLRLDARAIAHGSPLGAPVLSDGSGVVGIVDDLLTSGVGDEQIGRVNEVLRTLSPHVKSVGAKRHPASGGKELQFALRSGAVVPASQMSDGIVLAAGLVLISLWAGSRRLLIEEPENGLHPRQLKVVADAIRSIAEDQGAQVILTTHSPLLLNHFAAEEVLVVTRDQTGVHVQRMSDAQGLDDLASEMALGELWYNVGDSNLARPA